MNKCKNGVKMNNTFSDIMTAKRIQTGFVQVQSSWRPGLVNIWLNNDLVSSTKIGRKPFYNFSPAK